MPTTVRRPAPPASSARRNDAAPVLHGAEPRPKLAKLVAEGIIQDIVAQGWREGASLGTEAELIARYGVSRATLREAVRELERHGAVRVRRGVGLAVAAPARETVVAALASFIDLNGASFAEVGAVRNLLLLSLLVRSGEDQKIALLQLIRSAPPAEAPVTALARWQREFEAALLAAADSPLILLLLDALRPFTTPALSADEARALLAKPGWLEGCLAGRVGEVIHSLRAPPPATSSQARVALAPTETTKSKLALGTAHAIADALSGRVAGERLGTEAEFLQAYDVSRGTLREALALLESQGLLVRRRGLGGGLFRGRPDPRSVAEMAATYLHFLRLDPETFSDGRDALEPEVAALAALRTTPEQITRLHDTLARSASPDPEDREQGRLFHVLLADCSGNPVLSLFVQVVMRAFYALHLNFTPEFIIRVHETHAMILGAVEAHDADGARRAMQIHLEFARSCLQAGMLRV